MTEESDNFAETRGYKTRTIYGTFNLPDPTMEEVEMSLGTWLAFNARYVGLQSSEMHRTSIESNQARGDPRLLGVTGQSEVN